VGPRVRRPDGLADSPVGIAIDPEGSVLVPGLPRSASHGEDYVTVKYSSDGTELWVRRYDGLASQRDTRRRNCRSILRGTSS